MQRRTQGLLLALVGAVMVRLALGDAYLRYVTEWMKWPIALAGVLLVVLAVGPVLGRGEQPDDHDDAGHTHGVPAVTWLLVLPGLVAFMIAPPALGSFLAERRGDTAVVAAPAEPVTAPVAAAAGGAAVPLDVQEFMWRAQDGGESLADRSVSLTGFVSHGEDGTWYVSRMAIGCCAADAVSYRVQVVDAERPPRDQWVEVTGVHVAGSGAVDETGNDLVSPPAVRSTAVVQVAEPTQTYS